MTDATGQPRLHSDDQVRQYHAEGRWSTLTIVDYFDANVAATPDKVAIIDGDSRLTYRMLKRWSENIAAALAKLGIKRGDIVAIQAPNWAELPIVHLAAGRIGAIFVPLSGGFREAELTHLLGKCRAKVVFCPANFRNFRYADLILGLKVNLPALQHIVTLRGLVPGGDAFDTLAEDDAWRADDGEARLAALRLDADAPSHVMVSSGTTGLPRCSLFSDNNTTIKLLRQYVDVAHVNGEDIAAALAPAGTGATGYNYPILAMLLLGGTSVLLEHWNASHLDDVLELIEHHCCTTVVAVPAQLAQLVHAPNIETHDFSALRVITNSGAKLPSAVAHALEALFGCKVQSIYGTSEAGATAMTSIDDPDGKRHSTVGRPLEGQDVTIRDEHNVPLPQGATGEVCWRGANKSYGFLNDFEGTQQVWDSDGVLHSGDLGMIDDDGYLHIVGRKKDMIVRGGQNVNPGAIEEALLHHPSVSQVAVVPYPDAVMGERIAACVVARGDAAVSLDALKAMVREKGLAAWHQPELLVVLDGLPRNAGGKIDKNALAQIACDVAASAAATAQSA